MRRLRRTPALRRLVAETTLVVDDLVAPLFVREGVDAPVPIASMPGHFQHTVPSLLAEADRLASLGVPAVVLFGVPAAQGRHRIGSVGPRRGRAGGARGAARPLSETSWCSIADLCLDEYTDHGHCGVLASDGSVDNDATLELYGKVAVAQAAPVRTSSRRAG